MQSLQNGHDHREEDEVNTSSSLTPFIPLVSVTVAAFLGVWISKRTAASNRRRARKTLAGLVELELGRIRDRVGWALAQVDNPAAPSPYPFHTGVLRKIQDRVIDNFSSDIAYAILDLYNAVDEMEELRSKGDGVSHLQSKAQWVLSRLEIAESQLKQFGNCVAHDSTTVHKDS